MRIWTFSAISKDFTNFVPVDEDNAHLYFIADGNVKIWHEAPCLVPYIEKKKKDRRQLSDISNIVPGSVILNPKAYGALKDFLAPFGQFLPVKCVNAGGLLGSVEWETHYFYNVTNLIPCIDEAKSSKLGAGIAKPVFFPDAIPQDVQVFKDPLRCRVEIYLSETAKEGLQALISKAGLSGAQIQLV